MEGSPDGGSVALKNMSINLQQQSWTLRYIIHGQSVTQPMQAILDLALFNNSMFISRKKEKKLQSKLATVTLIPRCEHDVLPIQSLIHSRMYVCVAVKETKCANS